MTSRDVVIAGGGLAGLTLALQLRQQMPDLSIRVLERRQGLAPEASHKVGESMVEIGAHYLSHQIGLRDHLEHDQLKKFGLRFFFGAGSGPFHQADELGASRLLDVPSYQIDRGRLENELAQRVVAGDIELVEKATVGTIEAGQGSHDVNYRQGQSPQLVRCRWLVDASGRGSPLKRALDLGQSTAHPIHAAWFRVEGGIRVDDWSANDSWQARCSELPRWQSTNHLLGPGYWVWIIPLASGATSIGIVSDPALHPLAEFAGYTKTRNWLTRHQPRLADALGDLMGGRPPMDFRVLRHCSHDCRQVFSGDGWGLTGEAGVFLDPFYSPGTDFIAIGNSFLTDLIGQDRRGQAIARRCRFWQQLYFSFFRSTLSLYQDLYPGFGDRHLMVLKSVWDYAYYWSVLALLYFSDAMTDEQMMLAAGPDLLGVQQVNVDLQARFVECASQRRTQPPAGIFIDQQKIPLLKRLNSELLCTPTGDALRQQLKANIAMLNALAPIIARRLAEPTALVDPLERELLGDLAERLMPGMSGQP